MKKTYITTKILFTSTLLLFGLQLKAQNMEDLFKKSRFNGIKYVTETIVVKESTDFKNVLHIWKGKNHPCNAGKENGPQILRVENSNVIVKNFAYIGDGKTHGSNGLGDPIHVASCSIGQGNKCKNGPRNVVLDGIYGHACEDMITIGTPGTSNVTIMNSTLIPTPGGSSKWDKTIQINFGTDHKILYNTFVGGLRCVRFKPNTSGRVVGNRFSGCKYAVLMSSNDKDITPMQNGPSTVDLAGNSYNNSQVHCKDGGSVENSGRQTCD